MLVTCHLTIIGVRIVAAKNWHVENIRLSWRDRAARNCR
jgi:hypothetical protein